MSEERIDYYAEARAWLDIAEVLYGRTEGDPLTDGMLAAAIGQGYATLALADTSRTTTRPVSGPPKTRDGIPPAAIWGSTAIEVDPNEPIVEGHPISGRGHDDGAEAGIAAEDALGVPGLTAQEADDFTSGSWS